jgi:hypothetical protein
MKDVVEPMLVVAAAMIAGVALVLAVRWFERYRLTDAWRHSDVRAAALSFLVFFGGLFGHRLPPPPRVQSAQSARPQNDATDLAGRLRNAKAHSGEEDRSGGARRRSPSLPPEARGPAPPPSGQSGDG